MKNRISCLTSRPASSFKIYLLLALLLTLGVGQMWGESQQHFMGVACDNASNYDKMKINIKRAKPSGCEDWGEWEAYTLGKAGLTFDGKQLFSGEYWTCNGMYNLQYQFYNVENETDVWKEQNEVYAGDAVYDYYNNFVYNYDYSGANKSDGFYSQLTIGTSKVYFDASNWSETNIRLVVTHANCQKYRDMTAVTGTKLYYNNTLDSWTDAMGFGVVGGETGTGADARVGNGTAYNQWMTDISAKAVEYTGLRHYGLNNNGDDICYLVVNNGKAGEQPDVTYNASYTTYLNADQTVNTVLKADASSSYSAANSKAAIRMQSYKLTGQGSTTAQDVSLSTSVSTKNVTACRTATTVYTVGDVTAGYTFDGFYAAANGGERLDTETPGTYTHYPTAATTTYARFKANEYTITLKKYDGSGSHGTVTATYNSSSNITSVTPPTRDGYVFCGYYTLAYGTGYQLIDGNGDFNSNVTGYITDGVWTSSTGDVNLYAYWKKASSAGKYTFRYYESGKAAYNVESFAGDGNERTISNFTIPTQDAATPMFFVGYNEDFYASALGEGETKTSSAYMNWTTAYAETDGIGNGAMKLLPGSSAVGLASGAVGTLKIWTNDAHKNLSVGFLPSGYAVSTASRDVVLNEGSEYFYYTDPITISSTEAAGNFQVKLATSSSYVACAHGTAESAATVSGRKITGDADIANGKKGVFQMWSNSGTNNFSLRFVTVYDVSFDLQDHGSAISDYTDVRYNDKIAAPTAPTAPGYTFGGWYKEPACTNAWNFASDVVTATTTLYAKWTVIDTPLSFNASSDDNWSTAANWSPACVPTIEHDVVITKPVTVDITNARAKSVVIYNDGSTHTGHLDIPAGMELVIAGTLRKTTDGSSYGATGENDVFINSSPSAGLGALVMGSHDGTNKATINFYSKSHGEKNSTYSIAQYLGIPFNNEPSVLSTFYNSWVYKINNTALPNIEWVRMGGNEGLRAFKGYAVFAADAEADPGHYYWMQGTLTSSANHNCSLYKNADPPTPGAIMVNNETLLANSWMAPIKISAFQDGDFTGAYATIYIFNAGSLEDYKKAGGDPYNNDFITGDGPGQYSTYPIGSAGAAVIPTMQSFSVFTDGTAEQGDCNLALDYTKLVYNPAVAGTTPSANRAPRHAKVNVDETEEMFIGVRAQSGYGDRLRILAHEDFEQGFENGWDGHKMFGDKAAPQLYAITPDGNMAINCIPTFEGTVLGFKPGTEDTQYTFRFSYDGEEALYLNDLKEQQSTLINGENTYHFFTADDDLEARFVISATPLDAPAVATGVEGAVQSTEARKLIIDNKLYIIRNGRIYDATGAIVL